MTIKAGVIGTGDPPVWSNDLVNTPESKLRPPAPQLKTVTRVPLLEKVAHSGHQIVAIQAPGGFGKSTLAAQLASQSVTSAWASLDNTDSDPVVLVSTLLNALAGAQALTLREPGSLWQGGLSGDEPAFSRWTLPQFRRTVESTSPVTLVIDDVHLAKGQQATAVLAALVDSLPQESRVALVGRSLSALPLSLWQGQGRLIQVDARDLRFDEAEIEEALTGFSGTSPTPSLVQTVSARTDGWPVAVYLGSMSHEFRGGDSTDGLRQYSRDEILANADPEVIDFLRRSAPLEALSASLCSAAIEGVDAVDLLRRAESESLLISRIDGESQWFRLHTFLREFLLDDLESAHPQEKKQVHVRAARWFHEQGLADAAISHAMRSGDSQLLGEMLWPPGVEALLLGQAGRVRRWLAQLDDATVATSSGLSMAAAWTALVFGEYPLAMQWAATTAQLLGPDWPEHLHHSTVEPAFAMFMALGGKAGWEGSAKLAQEAKAALPTTSSLQVFADLSGGVYTCFAGDIGAGLPMLEQARVVAAARSMAATEVEASALAALVLSETGQVRHAAELIAQATVVWNAHRREGALTTSALLANSAALVASLNRDPAWSDHLARALTLAPFIAPVLPWFDVAVHSVAALCLSPRDEAQAAAHLKSARAALKRTAASPFLSELVAHAAQVVANAQMISVLTPAELRVWELLQGRQTTKEIADSLFLSPETVKSHLSSIYRKLNVTSRREAQDLADKLASAPSQDLPGSRSPHQG